MVVVANRGRLEVVPGIAICRRGIAQWHSLAHRLVDDESGVL